MDLHHLLSLKIAYNNILHSGQDPGKVDNHCNQISHDSLWLQFLCRNSENDQDEGCGGGLVQLGGWLNVLQNAEMMLEVDYSHKMNIQIMGNSLVDIPAGSMIIARFLNICGITLQQRTKHF